MKHFTASDIRRNEEDEEVCFMLMHKQSATTSIRRVSRHSRIKLIRALVLFMRNVASLRASSLQSTW